MATQSTLTRKRRRFKARRRRQTLQSAAILALVGLLVVGEIVRMRASMPESDKATIAVSNRQSGRSPAFARGRDTIANSQSPIRNRQSTIAPLTTEELTRLGVNEMGRFPILEYHDIKRGKTKLFRSPDAFRRDLARLYAENYRPISFQDYLDNHIDVPAGMTPVILTFDDARETQFRYLPDGRVDPDCAVGILQEFTRSHPDFPLKATFFVLTEWGFGPHKFTARKFQALRTLGCDLQNHTYTHHYFGRMTDDAIIKEIAQGKYSVEKMAPGIKIDILALPGGEHPRSKNEAILRDGDFNGMHYKNRAVVDAWGGPAPSPASDKFDPFRIPRIEPIEDGDGLTHWLDYLKARPKRRYISDGDPDTITVPRAEAKSVAPIHLQGTRLRVY